MKRRAVASGHASSHASGRAPAATSEDAAAQRGVLPDGSADGRALASDPLEDPVLDAFYRPQQMELAWASTPSPTPPTKPTHYKIVCISLYREDIERLERLVGELKRRGHTRANKSQLIRAALDQVDLDRIPKGY